MTIHANLSVTISIGNDATQTVEEVADLLRRAADAVSIRTIREIDDSSIPLRDLNGNRVGTVQVTGFFDDGDGGFLPGRYVYVHDGPRGDDEGLLVSVNDHTVVLNSYLHHDRVAVERRLVTVPLHD